MIGIDRVRRAAAAGAVVLGLVAAVTGCGKIATDDSVEEQITSQLGAETADCPDDLAGEVGRSIICQGTTRDRTFDVKVTVTSVEGDTINFDIQRVDGPAAMGNTTAGNTAAGDTTAGDTTAGDTTPASATEADVGSADPAAQVPGRNVAQSVLDQLAASGKTVDQVTCPGLPARVGATQRCTLTAGTETYGVTVTVTVVQGTDVKFDIAVDQEPQ